MSLLKIGGKTRSNTASAFLLGDDGAAVVSRPWKNTVTTLVDSVELRDADVHRIVGDDAIRIDNYPINSLRIRNTLDQNVTIAFYYDLNKASTTVMDGQGEAYQMTVEPSGHFILVTPDDLPLLNYATFLKFSYQASDVPTTGALYIAHVGKG